MRRIDIEYLLAAYMICLPIQAQAPAWRGDPEAALLLEQDLQAAAHSTETFGDLPSGPWSIHLHTSDAMFEKATGAPPQRFALWVGETLHLRPIEKLRRRDIGSILRHELVHRRLSLSRLRPWEEEARSLYAEGHTRPPDSWPPRPAISVQDRLDLMLRSGTTASQAWAYAWLRAWIAGKPLPLQPRPKSSGKENWKPDR